MTSKISEFDKVFFRLKELKIKNQRQLAKALGITAAPITAAKQKGVFPKGWAVKLAQKYDKSVDWILGLDRAREELSQEEENFKDESIRLMRTIIKQTQDMAEQKRVYDETLKERDEKIILLQSQLLDQKTYATKKNGKDHFNSVEAEKETLEPIASFG